MSFSVFSYPTLGTARRSKCGLTFNLLVLGPTGIGKTTLINSLFDFDYSDSPDYDRNLENVDLSIKEFRPHGQDMKLTIIETKGFDNQLDRSEIHKPIVDYITSKFEEYRLAELHALTTRFNHIVDSRVHLCIYIISPSTKGLKPIDLVTMKKLHQRVCLVPVIARSDQLTRQEREVLKKSIRKELQEAKIDIYSIRDRNLPFAVAASDEIIIENEKRQRTKSFPWGQMFIERDSDFPLLRDSLLRSDMLALIDTTNKVHYEKYREEWARESQKIMMNRVKKTSVLPSALKKHEMSCS